MKLLRDPNQIIRCICIFSAIFTVCTVYTTSSSGQLHADEEDLWANWTGRQSGKAGQKKATETGGGNNLGYVCVLSIPSSPG